MQDSTLEAIKMFISVLALFLSLVGLISSVIFYLSSRASICNQIYARWQTILLAQDKKTDKVLKDEEFNKYAPRGKEYYIALAYLNLYEEVFFYHEIKLLYIFPMVPETLWQAIQRSITAQLKRRTYIRTLWKEWKADDTYSEDFVKFFDSLQPSKEELEAQTKEELEAQNAKQKQLAD